MLALKSQRVVLSNDVRPATIVIGEGVIQSIEPYNSDTEAVDYGSLAILPGVIDPHVHFNEPGRSHWEGWESGTRAAIAGGVTTVVDMPLNCIPSTVDRESLQLKSSSTEDKLYCDVGLWGGAVPGNAEKLGELLEAGVLGFKCFLSDPGTKEFSNLDQDELREAMTKIAELKSVLLLHAEWPSALLEPDPSIPPESYSAWLHTRPLTAEREAIQKVVELSRETGCRCHIVHLSSGELADLLQNTGISSETCAHYLAFNAQEIGDGATHFKCAPPIRGKSHQESLWSALGSGHIQMVTSDHSPCPPDLKNPNFLASWGGISGVQMLLPAVWTGASQRGYNLCSISHWLSEQPAVLAGLDKQKGRIAPGLCADLVVFDPDKEFRCQTLQHRHAGSPYEDRTWKGTVEATYLRGQKVYQPGSPALRRGRLI